MSDYYEEIIKKIGDYFICQFDPQSFLIAFLITALCFFVKFIIKVIKNYNYKQAKLNVSGYWRTEFYAFKFSNSKIIEVYHIKQKSDSVFIHIQHYEESSKYVAKLKGEGKIRGNSIAFYYFTLNGKSQVIGTACLNVVESGLDSISLKGNYYEDYSYLKKEKQDEIAEKIFTNNMFTLNQLKLSITDLIRYKFSRNGLFKGK
jgi:hypothetical protein